MKKLLSLLASPILESNSVSRHITQAFLDTFETNHQDYKIKTIDLNGKEYLHHSLTMINMATYHSEGGISHYLLEEIKKVDKILISAPTINCNYPGVLKNFLDRIITKATWPQTIKDPKSGKIFLEGPFVGKKVQIITTMRDTLSDENIYHIKALENLLNKLGCQVAKSLIFADIKVDTEKGIWPCSVSNQYNENITKAALQF